MIASLKSALSYLKDGKGIHLGSDVFLCGELLDGSDKFYGFKKEQGQLFAQTRSSMDGYPIDDMEKGDLDYIFKLSAIEKNIINRKYRSVPLDVNGHVQELDVYSRLMTDVFSRLSAFRQIVEAENAVHTTERLTMVDELTHSLERAIDSLEVMDKIYAKQ